MSMLRGALGRHTRLLALSYGNDSHGSLVRSLSGSLRRFHSLGVSEELVSKLQAMGVTTPTPAQKKAIPLALKRRDVVIAAETGGGKTLAYLIPLLEQLGRHPLPLDQIHRPVALVMTTSQELVGQIASVLRQVDPELARHAVALSSTNQALPHRVCPLLIATPKALLRATKPKDFAFTEHIVVDEADMLLGGGFERDTKQIIATIRNQPLKKAALNDWQTEQNASKTETLALEDESATPRQTIFSAISFPTSVDSTIPDYGKRSVEEFIKYKFPNAEFAVTEDFHRTLPRLDLSTHDLDAFVASNGQEDEVSARMKLLWQILNKSTSSDQGNTLIFANSIESADALYEFLSETQGVECSLYHKEISRDERSQILQKLHKADANAVVVCTDIAARGLDTTTVRHVIQYEFANDVVSYIHRIGRTARAGTTGRVSSIVSKQNELVLTKIQEAGDQSLHGAFSRKRSLRKKVKKQRCSF